MQFGTGIRSKREAATKTGTEDGGWRIEDSESASSIDLCALCVLLRLISVFLSNIARTS
jgi:hypothetical protein